MHAVLRDDALEMSERLRLWLERDRRGRGLPPSRRGDRRARRAGRTRASWSIAVAGVSFRPEAVADSSFDPGARLALVPEPENEHDPNAVAIWNEERTLQAGYVPREIAAGAGRRRAGGLALARGARDCACCSCRPGRLGS